jgi:hypothetical protein
MPRHGAYKNAAAVADAFATLMIRLGAALNSGFSMGQAVDVVRLVMRQEMAQRGFAQSDANAVLQALEHLTPRPGGPAH